jgi:predicted protein tyrosine phosphatase
VLNHVENMNLIVTDRHFIEAGIVVRTPYIVISIYTPGTRKAIIPRRSGLKAVFYTAFHDAEPAEGLRLPPEIVLMTPEQAEAIWAFVRQHEAQIGSIVCHCEQGMSRSPAVALGLAEAYGSDTRKIGAESHPNQFVYRLMCQAIAESQKAGGRTTTIAQRNSLQ